MQSGSVFAAQLDAGEVGVALARYEAQAEPRWIFRGCCQQQAEGSFVVAHQKIGVPIVVDVADGEATADFEAGKCGAAARGPVFETATFLIAEKLFGLAEGERIPLGQQLVEQLDGTRDGDQIEPAVAVEVEEGGAEAGEGQAGRRQSQGRGAIGEAAVAEVDVERVFFALQVGQKEVLVAVFVEIAHRNTHTRFGLALGIERRAGQQGFLAEAPLAAAAPKLVGFTVVGYVEVEPAVPVVVERNHPEARAGGGGDPALEADVFEAAAAEVAEQRVGHRPKGVGSTIIAPARSGEAGRGLVETVVEVVGDVEVEPAVAVVIEEAGRRAPAGVPDASRRRDVFEAAVAPVAPELVRAVIREVKIDVAIVVDVAGRDAVTITGVAETAFGGDVAKAETAFLAKQIAIKARSNRARGGQGGIERAAAQHQDVEVAVRVGVEKADAGAHHLDQVQPATAAGDVVAEIEGGVAEKGRVGRLRAVRCAVRRARCDREEKQSVQHALMVTPFDAKASARRFGSWYDAGLFDGFTTSTGRLRQAQAAFQQSTARSAPMRLFLAATLDLSDERQAAKRVVDRLNELNQTQPGDELHLEIVDWNETAAPVVNLPEAAAFRNLTVEQNDIFVAAAWLRFDRIEDRLAGQAREVATERDFELAYNFWKTLRHPNAIFFRCMRLPRSLGDIDSREFDRIGLYFKRFDSPEKNRFSYHEFATAQDFEEHLEADLQQVVSRLRAERAAQRPAVARSVARGTTQFETKMEPGKAYEVSFLELEISAFGELAKKHAGHAAQLDQLAAAFQELAVSTSKVYGGELFSWAPQGGLLMFWSKRSYDHAIMSGLKVLHSLPVFNLDSAQNPLGEPIDIRASAHDAVIVFQLPIEQIVSADIHFVHELLAKGTEAGELTIGRRLLERIDDRLKPHFKFKNRYDHEPIYSCKLPTAQREGQRPAAGEFVDRLKRQSSLVLGLLQGPASGLDLGAVESVATAVDEAYSVINRFCLAFSSLDPAWPKEVLAELFSGAETMRAEEAAIWARLRELLADTRMQPALASRFEAMVQASSRRRSRPVVILEKLVERSGSLVKTGAEPKRQVEIGEAFLKAADKLIKADDLDSETALTELLLHHKNVLLEYLQSHASDERCRKLVGKLWETADLTLLDDLYSLREHRRADERKVFDVLVHPEIGDGRFRIVRELLASQSRPEEVVLGQLFSRLNLRPLPADLQVIWRCLVLGHPSENVRIFSAMKLTPHSMWQVISLPTMPIHSIYAIGDRMGKAEGDDARKIFFDCTRARIDQAADSFKTREEFESINKLILLLLGFNFLAETGYFERFDDILRKFLASAQAKGIRVEYFENIRGTLEEARTKAGEMGPSKPPAGIKNLPLTLQRRLAGEARYIYWFVTHPDPRIACETLRHIGLMHVERVLRLREVNATVLQALLRKPELFTRSQALIAALNHPKCTQEFANKYIPSLVRSRQGREALDGIAQNSSANPVVRAAAKRTMASAGKLGG